MGRGKVLNLALCKIKLSWKKNIGATSYKIKNESTNPTFPYSSDVDGKQICEKILGGKMLISNRAT